MSIIQRKTVYFNKVGLAIILFFLQVVAVVGCGAWGRHDGLLFADVFGVDMLKGFRER